MSDEVLSAVARGRDFLRAGGFNLEAAAVEFVWFGGEPGAVVDGLSRYQNPDGGFGRGLEADIGAPESNPFAACLALTYLRGLPDAAAGDMRARLGVWLSENQAEDGDWHFSGATRAGFLAPWFAEWTFPSLNPACNIAGLAAAQGIATPVMLERVAALFEASGSLDVVRAGEYYDLTPYAEYSLTGALPAEYLDALAETILRWAREDRFALTFSAAMDHAAQAYDMVLMIHVVPFMVDAGPVIETLARLASTAKVPVMHSMMGTLPDQAEWFATMEAAGVPMFNDVEEMAEAAGLLAQYPPLRKALAAAPSTAPRLKGWSSN